MSDGGRIGKLTRRDFLKLAAFGGATIVFQPWKALDALAAFAEGGQTPREVSQGSFETASLNNPLGIYNTTDNPRRLSFNGSETTVVDGGGELDKAFMNVACASITENVRALEQNNGTASLTEVRAYIDTSNPSVVTSIAFENERTIHWPAYQDQSGTYYSSGPSRYRFNVPNPTIENVGFMPVSLPSGYDVNNVRVTRVGSQELVVVQRNNETTMQVFNPEIKDWVKLDASPTKEQLLAFCNPYAQAMNFKSEDVLKRLQETKPETRSVNGKNIKCIVDPQTGIPSIRLQEQKNGSVLWVPVTPGNLPEEGREITTTIYPEEIVSLSKYLPEYKKRMKQFGGISLVQPSHYIDYKTMKPDDNLLKAIKGAAEDNDQGMMIGNLLWKTQFPQEASNDPEKATRNLLKIFFKNTKTESGRKYDYIGGRKPLRIILNHELLGVDNQGTTWWDPSDPYYKAWRNETLSKSLIIAMEEAQAAGLDLKTDVVFYYGSSSGTLYDGPYRGFVKAVTDEVLKAKQAAADYFKMPVDDVPYGLAQQAHVYKNGENRPGGHEKVPTKDQMQTTFTDYVKALKHLYIIEAGGVRLSKDDLAQYWSDLMSASHASGAEGVQAWLGARDPEKVMDVKKYGEMFEPQLAYWQKDQKTNEWIPSSLLYSITKAVYSQIPLSVAA